MKAGRVLENPVTGMRVAVILTPDETSGRSVVVEYELRPHTGREFTPPHIHRHNTERFEIVTGRAAYVIGGKEGWAGPGETIVVPPNTSHIHPWNTGDSPLIVRQTTESDNPDLTGLRNTLTAAETTFELAHRGKVDANGRPNVWQAAVIFDELFLPQSYAAGLPFAAQRVLIRLLAAMGRLSGYRATYYAINSPAHSTTGG